MAGKVPTLSEKVTFILALQRREWFSARFKDIHSAFARLKELHPGELDELVFSTGDVYPHSRRLEELFGSMLHCGILRGHIHFGGAQFAQYEVSPGVKLQARERLKKLTPEHFNLLPAMAEEFEQLCPAK